MVADVFGLQKNNMQPESNMPQNDFFIVRLRGGLGNQLFQYAAARIYNLTSGRPFKADITGYAKPETQKVPRGYKLQNFNLELPIATEGEVKAFKYPLGMFSKAMRGFKTKVLGLDYLDYHPNLFKSPITYLDGYFQSPLYYTGHEELIKKECSVRPELISDAAKDIEKQMSESLSVSIHIRRGDLATEVDAAKTQGLCTADYYEKAVATLLAEFSDVPVFYIFSDDIRWVKQYMHFPKNSVYVSDFILQDFEELYLMSKTKHGIIGNSTFSWWGAWLNENPNKIVIAPKQWTVVNTEHPTIIPANWRRI
jgi:hypothetical protein